MADPKHKPNWWSTLPGLLTAATGFVAALSGLVAGLNQLGIFRRDDPAPQVTAAAPRTEVAPEREEHTASEPAESVVPPGADPPATRTPAQVAPGRQTTPRAAAPVPRTPLGAPPPRPADTAPLPAAIPETSTTTAAGDTAPDTGDAPATPGDTLPEPPPPRATRLVLQRGTELVLLATARVCAPADRHQRLAARLGAPVPVGADTLATAGTSAVLRVRRRGSPPGVDIRLDSLVHAGRAVVVRRSTVTFRRREATPCVPAGARLAVALGAPLTLPLR